MSLATLEVDVDSMTARASSLLPRGSPLPIEVPDVLLKNEEDTWIWAADWGPLGRVVFKVYGHRSVFTRLRAPLIGCRVSREYEALGVLEAGGVPCSAPLLWGRGRSAQHGRFEMLALQEICGAVSLRDHSRSGGAPPTREDVSTLFRHVRRMHRIGVHHGALSWKNVLVVPGSTSGMQFFIVDLARNVLFPGDIKETRMARVDLLHLSAHLSEICPADVLGEGLAAYGLDASAARRLLARIPTYSAPPRTRKRLHVEFTLRALLARATRRGKSAGSS